MPTGILIGILHWFASHLILFSLLGFVVVGLFLFGVVEPPAGFRADARQQQFAADAPRPVPAMPPPSVPPPLVAPPVSDKPAEPAPAQQAVLPPPAGPAKRPKLIGGSLPVYDEIPREGHTPAARAVDGFRPQGMAAPLPVALGYEERIQRARRAFWNGEFELAEAEYMDVIAAYPDDADVFGELGNLYETTGKATLAGDAYFAAGVRLKASGDTQKLRQVIDILEGRDDQRAALLTR